MIRAIQEAAEPARRAKQAEDEALTGEIRRIHQDSQRTCGAKRVALDPAEARTAQGAGPANHKRVARLMRETGIVGRHQRLRRALTRQDKTAPPAPDLLRRDFTAHAADVKWCGDITYDPVGESGFVYLAVVIGLLSGRLIGWSIAGRHRADLVRDVRFADEAQARRETFHWIAFYNNRRRHRRAAMLAPVDYEQRHRGNSKYLDACATPISIAA